MHCTDDHRQLLLGSGSQFALHWMVCGTLDTTHWRLQKVKDIKVRLAAHKRDMAADPDVEAMQKHVAQVRWLCSLMLIDCTPSSALCCAGI